MAAAAEVKLTMVPLNGKGAALPAPAALVETTGAYVDFTRKDTKTAIVLSGSGVATIHAGDSFLAGNDIQVTATANGTAVCLDSARYKITTGEHKGKVHITGATSVKVQAFELPG